MKIKWLTLTVGLLLLIGLVGVVLGVSKGRDLSKATTPTIILASAVQNVAAQNGAAQLVGSYSGAITLGATVGGVYSDTLATPPPPETGTPAPPALGSIDLSLQLNQSSNTVSGYVSLDKTLVYTVEHTLGTGAASVKTGPLVNGIFDGTNLTLQSEKVTLVVSGQTVQRQFRLTGTSTTSDGGQISGEYRETLWGYTSVPVTVIGNFTLQRAGANTITAVLAPTAPNVGADTTTTTQGTAVTIPVLGNDSAANGGTLTVTAVGKPQFGAAATDGQNVTYTPNATFVGVDHFTYIVSDGTGAQAAGSVTITVNGPTGPNQPPTAANDNGETTSGTPVTIPVLGNDSDPNGDTLLITIDSQPAHGTAVVQNGQIVYTPAASYTGVDSFTYIISDGNGGTATATVTVTVGGQGSGKTIYLPVIQR